MADLEEGKFILPDGAPTTAGQPTKSSAYGDEDIASYVALSQFTEVVEEGDNKGVIYTEQLSVGKQGDGRESVFGEGDIIPFDTVFHCTIADTNNLTITNAIDITEKASSDSDSTFGLFNGTNVGNYILVGMDKAPFGGAKSKFDTLGTVEPANIIGEYLRDDTPTWNFTPLMATSSDKTLSVGAQKGWQISTCTCLSEQWRFGFDPDDLPTTWAKVTLNINGTDYTRYWARLRITVAITSDPVMEQLKGHTNRFKINADGATEYFGRSRYSKTLISGWQNIINNAADSPTNDNVLYGSGVTVGYIDNEFNVNDTSSVLVVQNIESGLDTSIPLLLDFSYYVKGTGTGDAEFKFQVFSVDDGFVYDGNNTPDEYTVIDTILTSSNLVRRTVRVKIPVYKLTDSDAILIAIIRDATAGNANDTLPNDAIGTNIKLTGYFWRP